MWSNWKVAASVLVAIVLGSGVVAVSQAADVPAQPAGQAPAADAKPADHARVENARKTAQRLGREEEAVKKAMDEFRAAVAAFKPGDLETLELTAEAGAKACEALEGVFKTAAVRARAYQAAMETLRDETERAPEVYRRLAAHYRAEAEKTKTPAFRANYVKLAENSDATVKIMQERLKDIDDLMSGKAEKKEMRVAEVEVVTFLDEGAKFFGDAGSFFRATPGAVDATKRKQFRDDLKALANECNEFMKVFETFSEKLKATAVSPKLKGEHEREKKAAELRAPLGKARAMQSEVEQLVAKKDAEWAILAPTIQKMVADGLQAQANKTHASWLASWQREERRYGAIPIVFADAQAHVLSQKVVEGACYPVIRSGVGVGYAKVTGTRIPEAFVVEAVEGTLRAGDFLLVKVG